MAVFRTVMLLRWFVDMFCLRSLKFLDSGSMAITLPWGPTFWAAIMV